MAFDKIGKGLVKVFGSRNERVLKSYWKLAEQVNELEPTYQAMSDAELSAMTAKFKERLAAGEDIDALLPDAFAVIRETSDRQLGTRNALLDEHDFDASQLSDSVKPIYDDLRQQLSEGVELHKLDVPVEFNAEIRRLYPESRPPFRFRHFDVQVIGGKVLYEGKIAEMATGEGKTLVSTLAAYLVYLTGRKVHVITVNDYLAKRDAEWMSGVYSTLGITVGAIQADMDSAGAERRAQYQCDITYGTNNEFGFDYLRDNMKTSKEQMVQGPLDFAIIDEVDSILIDEARTPLIISGPAQDDVSRYKKADGVCRQLISLQSTYGNLKKQIDSNERVIANAQGELTEAKKAKDQARIDKAQNAIEKAEAQLEEDQIKLESATQYYEVEYDKKAVHLTHEGIGAAQEIAGIGSFFTGSNMEWPHMLEQSLRAHAVFEREKDYVSMEGKIVIVDEFTGRLMHGRQWSDGLHQAVEAKENVQIKEESQTLATITLQNFFKLYGQLAGMTGTAVTEAEEFMNIYELDVVEIPTNRPNVRDDQNDMIFKTMKGKFNATVDNIYETAKAGRPVLVGTISIEKSEALSRALDAKYGLRHEVLNAKQHQREASIVEKAGCQYTDRNGNVFGNVTIATNMAGRGTDIKLGPGVAELGGLHIVGTERHESRRIDNQLRGRAGRQGDNGSSIFFLSFEDDLLSNFAPEWTIKALSLIGWEEDQPIYHKRISKGIEKAQTKVENRNYEQRKSLLEYDEVMDYQRKTFYGRRRKIIEGIDLKETIEEMIASAIENSCHTVLDAGYVQNCIAEWARKDFGVDLDPRKLKNLTSEEIEKLIKQRSKKNISNEIQISLGEYLEDYDDRSTWNLDALCRWAMSSFSAGLSAAKLRKMDAEEIEQAIVEAACGQVDKKDCSQLDDFTKEDFAVKTLAMWAVSKFDVKLEAKELNDLAAGAACDLIAEKVAEKYKQRHVEYPVEYAMNMVFGPDGPNVYGFESLATWANKKFNAGFTAENLQDSTPKAVHGELMELSKSYNNGRLIAEIDENISGKSDADAIAWANERFDAELDEKDIEGSGDVREAIVKKAGDFMRSELADLECYVLLQIYDGAWKDHLYGMDHLKESIFLRAFAEKDPKVEYKHEGYKMFNDMLDSIDERVTDIIFKVHLEAGAKARSVWNVSQTQHDEVDQFAMTQRQRAAAAAPQGERKVKQIKLDTPKVGRNDPCPCGSGKKYKKCCGKG